MLKNIDPLLNAEVLAALRAMGHGDQIVISDTNFPSDSVARQTVLGKLLRIDANAARVTRALLSVMPLDSFVERPASRMITGEGEHDIPAVQREVQQVVTELADSQVNAELAGIDRFKFYDIAKQSYCVITTQETRFYGCFMFTKGVIPPAD